MINFTHPVLRKGKEITHVPKGSSKLKEEAKQTWYVEYYFINPVTGKKQRFRETKDLNRIKDPGLKSIQFNALVNSFTNLLESGWNPFSANESLKAELTALSLKEAQQAFLHYHENKNSRPRTIISFKSKTKFLLDYFGDEAKITDLNTVSVTRFMLDKEAKQHWSAKTFVNSIAVYVNFFNFLKKTGRVSENPFENFSEKRKIEKSEKHQLFQDSDFKQIMDWLDRYDKYTSTFVRILYYTCIRPNELRLLQAKHCDIVNQTITIPAKISKNKRTQIIRMDDSLKSILLGLNLQAADKEAYITGSVKDIIGTKSQPEKTAYNRLQICFNQLNLNEKGYTLYGFKHYSNVKRYQNGWSLEEIKEANRHSSLSQTETYLRDLMKFVKTSKPVPAI